MISGIYQVNTQENKHLLFCQDNIKDISLELKEYNIPIIPNSHISLSYDNLKLKNIIIDNISQDTIFGILCVSSKVSYGKTKTGGTKRKFIPYDKKYPEFIVGSNKPSNVYDELVSIKPCFLDKSINIYYGEIIDYFGTIGETNSEINFYTKYAQYNWYKIEKKINIKDYLADLTPSRIDLTDINIISIDPPNCTDIDDAIHIKNLEDNYYELGIHIADVSSYIPVNSPLDLELQIRGESIYLPHKQINMIFDELSISHMSLIKNNIKRAFSLIININPDGTIKNYNLIKSLVNIKENYSYEQIDKLRENSNIKIFFDLAALIQKNRTKSTILLETNNIIDSHKLIEIFMVLANNLVAAKLKENNSSCLLRTHSGYKNDKLITKYNMAKAKYIILDPKEEININTRHIGLGEDIYTHFTSPIRRYADIIVHRLLTNINTCNNYIVYSLNDRQSKLNNITTNLEIFLKIIKLNKNILDNQNAQILGFNNNKIFIKILDLDISLEINIIPNKFKHLIEFNCQDNIITYTNKNNKNSISFELLQLVKVLISITIRNKNKINCTIVEPDISLLYI
jgi:exoribonuclease R